MFPTKEEVSLKDSYADSEVKTQAQAIDVKELSEEDLQSLRKEDPFMYYSIPAIRMATIHGKDIDPSDKVALCCSNLSSDGQQDRYYVWLSNIKLIQLNLVTCNLLYSDEAVRKMQ